VGSGETTSQQPVAWPFTGRADDVAAGRRGLAEQRGAIVFGEAGVGKTALADHLVAGGGPPWHVVTGSQGAGAVAFGAWSHLVPAGWDRPLDEVASWRAVARHLRSPDGAIRLRVEDAHWLDPGSAALLHHLVAAHRASAVVSSRRDPAAPPAVTALWKDGHLARIDLGPLTGDELGAVVEAALGAAVEPRTVQRLHARTGGNLLLARELVDDARRTGSLRLLHGAWVETGPVHPSPRLVDLLAHRLGDLAPEERHGAEVLAVAGPLERRLVERVVPRAVVRALVAAGIARSEGDGARATVAVADPLVADVLVDRAAPGRRDEALGALLDELEAHGERGTPRERGAHGELGDDDALRVAVWRLELGRPLEPAHAMRAADLASSANDFPTAERLAAAALSAGGGPAATIRLGEALAHQERHAAADAVLRPVADLLGDLDDDLRFRYADARALTLSTDRGMLDEAIEVLEATIATMADDRWRWALEAHLAFLLADRGRLLAARPLAEARLANVADDEPSALTAFVAGALIRTTAGRCLDTLALCEAMTPVAFRHLDDRPEALGWIAAAQMLATYVRGDLDAAAELYRTLELLVVDGPDPTVRAALLMSQGLVASEQGALDTALRLLHQAAALHELDNRRGYQSWCFAITSRVHALRGELVEAAEVLAAARRHLWPGGQVFAGDLDVAAIWVATLGGDRAGAARTLDEAVARAEAEGLVTVALRLRHEAIRAGLPVAPPRRRLRPDHGRRPEPVGPGPGSPRGRAGRRRRAGPGGGRRRLRRARHPPVGGRGLRPGRRRPPPGRLPGPGRPGQAAERGRAGPLRVGGHPGAAVRRAGGGPHRPGGRRHHPGGGGPGQPGDRRGPGHFGAHRRDPPPAGLRQARDPPPGRPGRRVRPQRRGAACVVGYGCAGAHGRVHYADSPRGVRGRRATEGSACERWTGSAGGVVGRAEGGGVGGAWPWWWRQGPCSSGRREPPPPRPRPTTATAWPSSGCTAGTRPSSGASRCTCTATSTTRASRASPCR
jgi:tetratricopeptide (TPR) repeat protein